MSLWVLLMLCAVVVLSIALIALGRRGRRINDHPQCTWCGFDLVGVYPGVVTCPECGAGLARKHGPPTVRMGVRVRRPVLIGVGVAGVLLPLLPLGVITVAAVTGASVAKHLPIAGCHGFARPTRPLAAPTPRRGQTSARRWEDCSALGTDLTGESTSQIRGTGVRQA
ncbi:MAG: hypothetical protein MUE97_07505 [Phycisphaerales bacterium]|jgi:predicted RNA-binding Zn-ribbon protein involved in translation (DUF1610 family)|nr:hypothetical protein [Phycisphaerales bacterium]